MAAPAQTVVTRSQMNVYEELNLTAGNAPYPGYLLMLAGTANPPTLSLNTVKGGPCLIATEDENQGKTVDDVFTAANRCVAKYLSIGDIVMVYVVDALAVTIGDLLTPSATAGKVEAATATPTVVTGVTGASGMFVSTDGEDSAPSASAAALTGVTAATTTVIPAQTILKALGAVAAEATERRVLCRVLRA